MSLAIDRYVAPTVVGDTAQHAARFAQRDPFRHVVIDDFFAPDYVERLIGEFPPFERGNALDENGTLGNKSTVERVTDLGPAYTELDALVRSREFLDLIGRITGIDALLYDPHYFGGGTHENRAGQDLDPHVDFNRHPIERWHRRLNLIVYLNREWHDAWGGSLELHSDPRSPNDRVKLVTPIFNRCVIFETTEWSWHGFSRIELPARKRDLTRKSIALYFYTTDRPREERADTHSTIYVDRPLPEHIQVGATLTEADINELRTLLARRDQHNKRLYDEVTRLTTEVEQLSGGKLGRMQYLLRRLRAGLTR